MLVARAESDVLHGRARAMIEAFAHGQALPEAYEVLATDVVRFQMRHAPLHQRLAAAASLTADSLTYRTAPGVPAEVWKQARVAVFPPELQSKVFQTSGTTQSGVRGIHAFRDLDTYAAGALAMGKRGLACDLGDPPDVEVLVLGPSPAEQPESSLTFMNALFAKSLGVSKGATQTPASSFFLNDGVFDLVALDLRIAAAQVRDRPVLLLATSFALVHLLDALGRHEVLALPRRSRVMQTGGFKGKSREVSAQELRVDIARLFAIPETSVISEYGMTELSSQFYEATLAEPALGRDIYVEPPWARVVPVDPETFTEVAFGEVGVARIEDALNIDSAFAVLTEDRVRRVAPSSTATPRGGFELLGRAPKAPQRGCSLATEALLDVIKA
jgi:Acyl-protein synthetase, LuxE